MAQTTAGKKWTNSDSSLSHLPSTPRRPARPNPAPEWPTGQHSDAGEGCSVYLNAVNAWSQICLFEYAERGGVVSAPSRLGTASLSTFRLSRRSAQIAQRHSCAARTMRSAAASLRRGSQRWASCAFSRSMISMGSLGLRIVRSSRAQAAMSPCYLSRWRILPKEVFEIHGRQAPQRRFNDCEVHLQIDLSKGPGQHLACGINKVDRSQRTKTEIRFC